LPVEERGNGDFVASDGLSDCFEGEILLLLGFEKSYGGKREARGDVLLAVC